MAEETSMSGVTIGHAETVAGSKTKLPARGRETDDLIQRGLKNDKSCLPEIRALFADGDRGRYYRESLGSSADWFRQSIFEKAAGEAVIGREAIDQILASIRLELEGPNPTAIERLLAERASLCWFMLHRHEDTYVNSSGWSIHQVDLQQRKIDKAHARFLSSLLTLARVRKLALPTLQLNIARNQVNMAKSRP